MTPDGRIEGARLEGLDVARAALQKVLREADKSVPPDIHLLRDPCVDRAIDADV